MGMLPILKGYRTYIIAVLMLGVGLVQLANNEITVEALLNSNDLLIILNGLGLAALRAGIQS